MLRLKGLERANNASQAISKAIHPGVTGKTAVLGIVRVTVWSAKGWGDPRQAAVRGSTAPGQKMQPSR